MAAVANILTERRRYTLSNVRDRVHLICQQAVNATPRHGFHPLLQRLRWPTLFPFPCRGSPTQLPRRWRRRRCIRLLRNPKMDHQDSLALLTSHIFSILPAATAAGIALRSPDPNRTSDTTTTGRGRPRRNHQAEHGVSERCRDVHGPSPKSLRHHTDRREASKSHRPSNSEIAPFPGDGAASVAYERQEKSQETG